MSGWTKAHEAIRDELVGKTGVRVLLVEGADDKAFISNLLDKKKPGAWENEWAVGVAGGKRQVLKILEAEPDWLGIVDTDDWSADAAREAKDKHPKLRLLPRFCMENYFIDPAEIWEALPDIQRDLLNGREAEFKQALAANMEQWLRHGVLWHTINPLWEGLRALGFKEKLLDPQNIGDDQQIKTTLSEWHNFLDPDTIFKDFEASLQQARSAPIEIQYR